MNQHISYYKNCSNHQQGFTLVELMIVVAIIGVLSAIAVPVYKNYVKKSEIAAAVVSLKNLVTPAELYYQEYGNISTTTNMATALGIGESSMGLGTISITGTNIIQLNLTNRSEVTFTLSRTETGWQCTSVGLSDQEKAKGCD